jgi:hypothetical protein
MNVTMFQNWIDKPNTAAIMGTSQRVLEWRWSGHFF